MTRPEGLIQSIFDRMGKTVSAFDSSASWVDVSRCEIEFSYIPVSVSRRTLQCRVRHFTPIYVMTNELQLLYHFGHTHTYTYTNTSNSE